MLEGFPTADGPRNACLGLPPLSVSLTRSRSMAAHSSLSPLGEPLADATGLRPQETGQIPFKAPVLNNTEDNHGGDTDPFVFGGWLQAFRQSTSGLASWPTTQQPEQPRRISEHATRTLRDGTIVRGKQGATFAGYISPGQGKGHMRNIMKPDSWRPHGGYGNSVFPETFRDYSPGLTGLFSGPGSSFDGEDYDTKKTTNNSTEREFTEFPSYPVIDSPNILSGESLEGRYPESSYNGEDYSNLLFVDPRLLAWSSQAVAVEAQHLDTNSRKRALPDNDLLGPPEGSPPPKKKKSDDDDEE